MHYNQRTLLIIICGLLCGFVLLAMQLYRSAIRGSDEINSLVCTAKSKVYIKPRGLILSGTLVLDLESNQIFFHYVVENQKQEQQLFFQDIKISPLNRTGIKTYTFEVNAVHKFNSDTTGGLFSWLRLLQPTTVNELTVNKIGRSTYLFSLNRQIYNFCTTSSGTKPL
ncbi:hypothetical protein QMH89_004576 [Salmonella enterica]|nr:hypothetical protein [Salmonella enterica]